MSGSAAEREIRDHAAARLRQMMPEARIIHELVVGGCRADLAAVQPERITLVEIKSRKDTLKRLEKQVRQFGRAAHEVIVIADEKWFDTTPYNSGAPRFVPSEALQQSAPNVTVWAYPESEARPNYSGWSIPRWWGAHAEPHAARLLEICWKDELLAECQRHRIPATGRTSRPMMIRDMALLMTGREIARAVCRQLRMRPFPEGDVPIFEERTAA